MISVVMASLTVAYGGQMECPKLPVFASLLLSPGLLPRRRVGLSCWCQGEAYGDDERGVGWLNGLQRWREKAQSKCF